MRRTWPSPVRGQLLALHRPRPPSRAPRARARTRWAPGRGDEPPPFTGDVLRMRPPGVERGEGSDRSAALLPRGLECRQRAVLSMASSRSEEHTSELQSPCNLVCRLLLEKKKQPRKNL